MARLQHPCQAGQMHTSILEFAWSTKIKHGWMRRRVRCVALNSYWPRYTLIRANHRVRRTKNEVKQFGSLKVELLWNIFLKMLSPCCGLWTHPIDALPSWTNASEQTIELNLFGSESPFADLNILLKGRLLFELVMMWPSISSWSSICIAMWSWWNEEHEFSEFGNSRSSSASIFRKTVPCWVRFSTLDVPRSVQHVEECNEVAASSWIVSSKDPYLELASASSCARFMWVALSACDSKCFGTENGCMI